MQFSKSSFSSVAQPVSDILNTLTLAESSDLMQGCYQLLLQNITELAELQLDQTSISHHKLSDLIFQLESSLEAGGEALPFEILMRIEDEVQSRYQINRLQDFQFILNQLYQRLDQLGNQISQLKRSIFELNEKSEACLANLAFNQKLKAA